MLEVTSGRLGFHFTVYYLGFRLAGSLLLRTDLLNCFFSQEANKQNYKHNPLPLPRIGDLRQAVRILNLDYLQILKSRVNHLEPHEEVSCRSLHTHTYKKERTGKTLTRA